jgi:hypothetical protein
MGKDKIECLVKGKVLKLTPEAFKIAEKYFGAERMSELAINKPIELSKPILIPKPIEIKRPVISKPIEKPVEKAPEPQKTEVIAKEVAEPLVVKVPVKKAPVKNVVAKKVKK